MLPVRGVVRHARHAPHGAADPRQGARGAVAQGTGVGAHHAVRVGARAHHRPGAVERRAVRGRGRPARTTRSSSAPPTARPSAVPLRARPVAEFWTDFNGALRAARASTSSSRRSRRRCPTRSRSPTTPRTTSYDPRGGDAGSGACSRVIEPVFAAYRADFQGKVSRVQFFWGQRRPRASPASPASRARRRPVPACSIARRTTTSR